eukprot:ctg_2636.g585
MGRRGGEERSGRWPAGHEGGGGGRWVGEWRCRSEHLGSCRRRRRCSHRLRGAFRRPRRCLIAGGRQFAAGAPPVAPQTAQTVYSQRFRYRRARIARAGHGAGGGHRRTRLWPVPIAGRGTGRVHAGLHPAGAVSRSRILGAHVPLAPRGRHRGGRGGHHQHRRGHCGHHRRAGEQLARHQQRRRTGRHAVIKRNGTHLKGKERNAVQCPRHRHLTPTGRASRREEDR